MVLEALSVISGSYIIYSCLKKDKKEEEVEDYTERTENYNNFFDTLGLLKDEQWVEVIDYSVQKNFKQIAFKLSDNLTTGIFYKHIEDIKEKLQVNDLKIFVHTGHMIFVIKNENIQLPPYCFKPTASHLIPCGVDMNDEVVSLDIKTDPHILIVGTTGSGKSRLLNAMLDHIINNADCRLYLVDLKRGLELGAYYNIKQTKAYAETLEQVEEVLKKIDEEAEKRYKIFKENNVTNYDDYKKKVIASKMPRSFIIIDEFADITRNKKSKMVDKIIDMACKLRALGMHIIICTQKPTADFINTGIKANMTGVIGMRTKDTHNSNLIIDRHGCEKLKTAEAICIFGGQEHEIRAFKFDRSITNKTVAKHKKQKKKEVEADSENLIKG